MKIQFFKTLVLLAVVAVVAAAAIFLRVITPKSSSVGEISFLKSVSLPI